eukprot:140449-Chlamydomonas_euryale.AAC.10
MGEEVRAAPAFVSLEPASVATPHATQQQQQQQQQLLAAGQLQPPRHQGRVLLIPTLPGWRSLQALTRGGCMEASARPQHAPSECVHVCRICLVCKGACVTSCTSAHMHSCIGTCIIQCPAYDFCPTSPSSRLPKAAFAHKEPQTNSQLGRPDIGTASSQVCAPHTSQLNVSAGRRCAF